jgi:hypothetical protein
MRRVGTGMEMKTRFSVMHESKWEICDGWEAAVVQMGSILLNIGAPRSKHTEYRRVQCTSGMG